jgi:hypothetical protein
MNLDEFNTSFPSFAKQFETEKEKQNKIGQIKDKIKRTNLFHKTFPDLLFEDLIEQDMNISTDDGCFHYKHKHTNKIYSYDYDECCFYENTHKGYQTLFE